MSRAELSSPPGSTLRREANVRVKRKTSTWLFPVVALALGLLLAPYGSAATSSTVVKTYNVVLAGSPTADGFSLAGAKTAVLALVASAGGTVSNDLSSQIGVLTVHSANELFDDLVRTSGLVEEVGEDFNWKAFASYAEAFPPEDPVACFEPPAPPFNTIPVDPDCVPPTPTPPGQDTLQPLQWDMQQICADKGGTPGRPCTQGSHDVQPGIRAVEVGILDSGIDGHHPDFLLGPAGSNVDCPRGHNSLAVLPPGVAVGNPDPCTDNQFHGTHVAGTVAAQKNGIGVVGVAPGVLLIPVKVCDSTGYCYASAVTDGITYAGDKKFEAINMSFFVDDNEFQESTRYKCSNDPVQRTFRRMVERAIQYARSQGVTPVAALGNDDEDLAHPPDVENNCEMVPQETQGVIGTGALGRDSEKSSYSNYGVGMTDIVAPGGNGTTGVCSETILSTFPGGTYACIQGTSMASPHATGVVALIISQFGQMGSDGDWKMSPTSVEAYLQGTAVDIGLSGNDECFGNGRIDALRAVQKNTSRFYDSSAPFCPEYSE
jgi:lantibiotic leader peptide-processing serine protease